MDRILIYENKKEIGSVRKHAESALRAYNILYEAYVQSDIPLKVDSVEGLYDLGLDPETRVKQALLDKLPKTFEISGVSIRQEAVISHIDMPDITKLIQASRHFRRTNFVRESALSEFDLFKIEKGKVILDEKEIEEECERFRVYANTPEQKEVYALLQGLCDKLNQAKSYFGKRFTMNDQLEDELRPVLKEGGKYIPNHHFIVR